MSWLRESMRRRTTEYLVVLVETRAGCSLARLGLRGRYRRMLV